MFDETEIVLDDIPNYIEDTRSDGDAGHQFVTSGRLGDKPGRRAGDRFRRGRMRSIISHPRHGGVTKSTRHSARDVSSEWKLNNIIFYDCGQLNLRKMIPVSRPGRKLEVARAVDQITGENVNVNRRLAGDEPCSSPNASCDYGGIEEDRIQSPELSNEGLLAYIREIRAKSKTLLYDFRQLRYKLRVYPA